MKTFLSDLSFSSFVAGFISLLVGYTSSAVIVYQAAIISGAGPVEATSWLGVLCVSMGILTVVLSLKYKAPVMFAWSTAGGAILMGSVQGFTLNQIIGSFIVSALLIFLSGCKSSSIKSNFFLFHQNTIGSKVHFARIPWCQHP